MAIMHPRDDAAPNPFAESAALILRLFSFTLGPPWLRGIMGTTFFLAVAIAIINMFSLCTILARGRGRGQNQLWVWRKMYTADFDPPYFIPNGQLFSVLCGMGAAIAMAVSACEFSFVPPGLVWTSNIPVLPTTFGSWMVAADAWAALWGVSFSRPASRAGRLARHPYFINAICWGWPTAVLLVELGILVWMTESHERLRHVASGLVDLLGQAAQEYDAGGMAAVTVLDQINASEEQLAILGTGLFYAMRVTTCVSAAFAIVAVLLFSFALVLVRGVYRNFIKLAKPSFASTSPVSRSGTTIRSLASVASILFCRTTAGEDTPPAPAPASRTPSGASDRAHAVLVAQYRRLLLSLSIMAIALAADAATALTTAFYLTAVHLHISPTRYPVYMGLTVLIFIPHFFPDTTLAFLSLMRVLPLWKKPGAPAVGKDKRRVPAATRSREVGLFDSFEAPSYREPDGGTRQPRLGQNAAVSVVFDEERGARASAEKESAETEDATS